MISEATDKAVEKRDVQWRDHIKQNYVKKEIENDLNDTIKETEKTILNLKNENKNKDDLLRDERNEMSQFNALKDQKIRTLKNEVNEYFWKNIDLRNENQYLHNYIGNILYL